MTLGRCPLSISCSRGTSPNPESITVRKSLKIFVLVPPRSEAVGRRVYQRMCAKRIERMRRRRREKMAQGSGGPNAVILREPDLLPDSLHSLPHDLLYKW